MPRVSVLIPAYKPRHLSQAIASVLAQTFDDYELLLSDDDPGGAVAPPLTRVAPLGRPTLRCRVRTFGSGRGALPGAFLVSGRRGCAIGATAAACSRGCKM
jgi:cellulose synthase/poly-beta-1,6-N-acetylglucosamine synthase-like glycosyltransferase